MSCWVVIPVKAVEACKTRLASVIAPMEREALVRRMLGHVVETAEVAVGVDAVMLLGPSRHDLRATLPLLADPGNGLNAALRGAANAAAQAGVDRLIVLPGDLPLIARDDVEKLAGASELVIAPDRSGSGTNALSLPLPAAAEFAFRFGEGSFALHCAEAERLSLTPHILRSETLAFDIDEPADLALLAERAA